MKIVIPGREPLDLEYLLLDANGTVTFDGSLIEGVLQRLDELAGSLKLIVITADTLGTANKNLAALPGELMIIEGDRGALKKKELVQCLGPDKCAAVGNGENDRLMLEEAALGVVVIGPEGASSKTVTAADAVAVDILQALDLFLRPSRLEATLRD
jgi:soluble P-type ATPase